MHDYESNPIPHQFDSKPKQENSTTQTPTPPPLLRELDLSEYQDLEAVDDLKSQELEYMITPSFNQITLKQEVLSESPFPLGCIISPFPELSEEIPTIYHEPTRCTSCGAIPTNLSQVDVEKNSYKCSICGKINGNLSLSNIQKKEDSQPSDNDHHFSLEENHSKAKVKHDECYYIDQSDLSKSLSPQVTKNGILFLVDGTLSKSHLFSISSTLSEVLNQLDKKIVIGLIVFSSVIEIYEVEHVTFSSADVYRGDQVPSPNDLARLLAHETDSSATYCSYLPPLHLALKGFLNVLTSLPGYTVKNIFASTMPSIFNSMSENHNMENEENYSISTYENKRCLGAAILYAMELFSISGTYYSHMIILLSNGCNYGPGRYDENDNEMKRMASEFYHNLAKEAAKKRIVIDLFSYSQYSIGVKILSELIYPLGGQIHMLSDWTNDFKQKLTVALQNAFIPPSVLYLYFSKGVSMKHIPLTLLNMDQSKYGVCIQISRSMSGYMLPVLFSLSPSSIQQSITIQCEVHLYSYIHNKSIIHLHAIQIPVIQLSHVSEPSLPSVTSSNDLKYSNEKLLNSLLSSSKPSSSFPSINSLSSNSSDTSDLMDQNHLRKESLIYYDSINSNVVLLLMIKDLIYQTTQSNILQIYNIIDHLVYSIFFVFTNHSLSDSSSSLPRTHSTASFLSSFFSSSTTPKGISSFLSSLHLPSSFITFPLFFYSLRQGPLLSLWNNSNEEQIILRNIFLSASYYDSFDMILPSFYISRQEMEANEMTKEQSSQSLPPLYVLFGMDQQNRASSMQASNSSYTESPMMTLPITRTQSSILYYEGINKRKGSISNPSNNDSSPMLRNRSPHYANANSNNQNITIVDEQFVDHFNDDALDLRSPSISLQKSFSTQLYNSNIDVAIQQMQSHPPSDSMIYKQKLLSQSKSTNDLSSMMNGPLIFAPLNKSQSSALSSPLSPSFSPSFYQQSEPAKKKHQIAYPKPPSSLLFSPNNYPDQAALIASSCDANHFIQRSISNSSTANPNSVTLSPMNLMSYSSVSQEEQEQYMFHVPSFMTEKESNYTSKFSVESNTVHVLSNYMKSTPFQPSESQEEYSLNKVSDSIFFDFNNSTNTMNSIEFDLSEEEGTQSNDFELYPLLPESLYLLSDSYVLLDNFTDIYIWIGQRHAGCHKDPVFAEILQYANELAQGRYPCCTIHQIHENTIEERQLIALLFPTHNDPKDSLIFTNEFFASLSKQNQNELLAKLQHYNTFSFKQYIAMIMHMKV